MIEHDLNIVLCRDRHFLRRAFRQPERFGGKARVEARYLRSAAIYQKRLAALPVPTFDDSLPVHERRADIQAAIAKHQVVIVCGETGSGKTTQIPKICLALGRGVGGLIGHTQPRRLAARSVAERIAEELNSNIGHAVGYQVRFQDKTSPQSYIKLMTDGILLAQTQNDRFLSAYDTLIIDEAHERSLNIDFLLGYLKQLLPKRPDLKVIITSATIDAERFATHFAHKGKAAPVIEVSGRTYPVQVRYRPLHDEADGQTQELSEAIVDAADELAQLGKGDILVFLPGEREIRETAEALRQSPLRKDDEILPLFARLSHADQQKIFHPSGSRRRIVLSTNVAETSLTVPGIRYVIDSGLARIKRYSARAKVEQLLIEKIAQSSAKQRTGRCGRVAAGVCIRLYDEADFQARSAFTDPEIIRSNLAAVILQMAGLRLGDVGDFPFLDAPEQRYINDGFQILLELGAIDDERRLTNIGKEMLHLPTDPKVARMLLAAKKHHCVGQMLIIVAALSIQDPRERPFELREAADKAHERFADKRSDFLAYINIWASFERVKAEGKSNRQQAQWCRQYFLSYLRMREWRDLYHQLTQIALQMGLCQQEDLFRLPENSEYTSQQIIQNDADLSAKIKQKKILKKTQRKTRRQYKEADYAQIHRALLSGLIANIGFKNTEGHDYLGVRGNHFHLFPASALFKSKPKWVMAAQLTETGKLYARDVAQIEPEWVELEAPHLVRYHYFEPHWSQKRGEVVASERVTLYGLTILPRRAINYAAVAPQEAREFFIRGALVAREADIQAAFFHHNQKLIQEVAALEHKSRKQDVLVDEETVFAFYDQRLPEYYLLNQQDRPLADIRTFNAWRKHAEAEQARLLFLSRDDLMQHAAAHVTENQFPHYWQNADGKFKLNYRFEPHHPLDGVTLTIPLPVLNRLSAAPLSWLVPGMIREKLQLLIKALPKNIRRLCVPVPEFITHFLGTTLDLQQAILPQLANAIGRHVGNMRVVDEIDMDSWLAFRLPEHCYMNIRVVDDGGQELAMGRDLNTLKKELGHAAALTFRDNSQDFEREQIQKWDIGTLPEHIRFARGKQQLTGYLALQQEKEGIALRLFDTVQAAQKAHRKGVIALMAKQLPEQIKDLNKGLPDFTQTAMLLKHIGVDNLKDDLSAAVCDRAFIGEDDLPRNEKDFKEQIKRARSRLPAVKEAINQHILRVAEAYSALNRAIGKHPLAKIIQRQQNALVYIGFAYETPWAQWQRLPIYLAAMERRLEKYSANPARDQAREADIDALWQEWREYVDKFQQKEQEIPVNVAYFRWMIEELRVSLFAQELKTPYPVSIKRLTREWEKIIKEYSI